METLSTGAVIRHLLPAIGGTRPGPAILIVHGWRSSVLSMSYKALAVGLTEIGYHVFPLSLRGHDGAEGDLKQLTRDDHALDIKAAYEHMIESPHVEKDSLALYGASYGAYMLAASLPSLAGVQSFAMRAPALYPDADWNRSIQDIINTPSLANWRSVFHPKEHSRALMGLAKFPGDVLMVRSENDEQMPVSVTESYLKATPGGSFTGHTVLGAGHVLGKKERDEFLNVTLTWFLRRFPLQCTAP